MAKTFALLMSGASSVTIKSSEGWNMAYNSSEKIPGGRYQEWRQWNSSWFLCEMATMKDAEDPKQCEPEDERAGTCENFKEHKLPNSNKAFYTIGTSYDADEILVFAWNETKGFSDVRVCEPRSRRNGVPLFSCAKAIDDTDCPDKCYHLKNFFCRPNVDDDSCTTDPRCVPEVAHRKMDTNELRVEGNRCLATHGGDIITETCDGSPSQQWTFNKASDAVLV